MRAIKFRAWDKESKFMFEVDNLSFLQGGIHVSGYGVGDGWALRNPIFEDELKQNIILMQFTGIHDKSGRDVYEGDIVTWGFVNVEVKFGTLEEGDDKQRTGWIVSDCFVDSDCEVIGNIHENPELLIGKEALKEGGGK